MKEYIYLAVCTVIQALQLQFCKIYQLKANTKKASLAFPIITGVTAFLMFFAISGFSIEYSTYSFIMALVGAIITTAVSLIGLKAVEYVPVGLYSAFLMLGALILPFIYGAIVLKEEVKALMIVGVLILVFALIFNSLEKGQKNANVWKGLIYCFIVFALNGTFGILSKCHQINETAINTGSFLQWVTIFQSVFSSVIFAVKTIPKKESQPESAVEPESGKKPVFIALGLGACYSVCWGMGFYLQLLALKILPVSLVNPIVTSAVIVLSWVFSIFFFKEKVKSKQIMSNAFIILGIVLFFI